MNTHDKLAEAIEHTARHRAAADGIDPDKWRAVLYGWEDRALATHAAEAAQIGADPALSVGGCESVDRNKQMQAAEPVAWTRQDVISDDGGCPIGMDEPRIAWGAECPDYEGGWAPLYSRPQPAQDAKDARTPDFIDVSFEVWQNDEMVASCSGPEPQALTEAKHYASQYSQDGPVSVFRVSRVRINTAMAKESG